ncbi:MAG: metal ABC transporter substrate-binding protein [Thermomicrobiales bacterium]
MMVDNIADALAGADPDNASIYRNNATAYRETLEETDRQIRALIDEIPEDHRKLVTNHDAFEYFARRYGLEVIGTVIPGTSSEADPSASDIAELTQLIEEENVRAIFAEALIDPKVAESLASDTGVESSTASTLDKSARKAAAPRRSTECCWRMPKRSARLCGRSSLVELRDDHRIPPDK